MRVDVDPSLLTRLTAELRRRGIDMMRADTRDHARETVLGLIPPGATVMAGSSLTLEAIGLTDRLRGGAYRYLRQDVRAIDDPERRYEMRRHSVVADYFLGASTPSPPPERSSTSTAAAVGSRGTRTAAGRSSWSRG